MHSKEEKPVLGINYKLEWGVGRGEVFLIRLCSPRGTPVKGKEMIHKCMESD